ncbi:MAG: MBL fold metallo-hydrolase [Thermoflexales bacterium]|nr:MBL fold metallo-hydrolase [Thermoflexales bacterium]
MFVFEPVPSRRLGRYSNALWLTGVCSRPILALCAALGLLAACTVQEAPKQPTATRIPITATTVVAETPPATVATLASATATVATLASATATVTAQPGGINMPSEIHPITLTIVYDNQPFDARLKTAWGFACLVETGQAVILFDTGGDGPTLMSNMAALGIDPRRVDSVVLSHYHSDHTGGLDALLEVNDHTLVYAPRSFPADFKARVGKRASVIEVSKPVTVAEHIRTTGEMGTAIIEQSLLIETSEGLIVMTGCAHPGIVEIVRQAKTHGEIFLAMGGFHLKDKSASQVEAIIAEFKQSGVRRVAPSHCTGDGAIRQFKEAFGADFITAGAGAVIHAER